VKNYLFRVLIFITIFFVIASSAITAAELPSNLITTSGSIFVLKNWQLIKDTDPESPLSDDIPDSLWQLLDPNIDEGCC
jgi:hypothetical protein